MKVIVTGAAGFIGSNIVKALNARGVTDIVAVDNLTRAEKMPNLADCEIADYLDKEDFIARVRSDELDADAAAVLHQGACSDTMESDGRYMMENNYRYSLDLLDWCQPKEIAIKRELDEELGIEVETGKLALVVEDEIPEMKVIIYLVGMLH